MTSIRPVKLLSILLIGALVGCNTSHVRTTAANEAPASTSNFQQTAQQPASNTTNYYVSPAGSDSNPGSSARPWRRINHAVKKIGPGATVHVAPGTYTGSILSSVSGTPTSRIRFISDQQWSALIIGTSGEAVWQNSGDYVDIVGFDVSGPNANGIENLGSYDRILDNHVHNITASCDSNGGSGINDANYNAHDDDIIGNFVHDVRAVGTCDSRHGVGIYHSNLRGHVVNNISVRNGTVGIQLWHAASNVVVANNTVAKNSLNGIVIGAGDSPDGVINDNTIVANNISAENGYFGIQEFGQTGEHNLYRNNIVHGNASGDITLLTGKASGTKTISPMLINIAGFSSSDFGVREKSPAIASGDRQYSPSLDFRGGFRPPAIAPDIGAFQSNGGTGKWPWE